MLLIRKRATPETDGIPAADPEVARMELSLVEGRLYLNDGQAAPFTGWMTDTYADGSLRSRSFVSNGVLHGISRGYFTNGVMQVEESFIGGVSSGARRKWHTNGERSSEVAIVEGELHGVYRTWDEKGRLLTEVEMKRGQPDGLSLAYFPSGFVKARVLMRQGQVVQREEFSEEDRETVPAPASAGTL